MKRQGGREGYHQTPGRRRRGGREGYYEAPGREGEREQYCETAEREREREREREGGVSRDDGDGERGIVRRREGERGTSKRQI